LPPDVVQRCRSCANLPTVHERMQLALDLAAINVARAGGPFAAAVFDSRSGELIAAGVNRVVVARNSVAHAETLAIMLAQQQLGVHDLTLSAHGDYELVTTAQPCVQCFGAVWWSGLRSLVVSARADDVERITGFREGPLPANWKECLEQRSPLPGVRVTCDVLRDAGCRLLEHYVSGGGRIYNPGGG
jgi:tRNA(Arg) A34 adenosine deaminase TadA